MAKVEHTTTTADLKGRAFCGSPPDGPLKNVIMAGFVHERPRASTLSNEFSKFLPLLASFVEAERDLDDVCHSFDVAYSVWDRDCRRARAELEGFLSAFHRLPVQLPEDRPLRHVALLVDAMLNDDEPARPRHLHRQMQLVFFQRFQVPGFGPTAQHRNGLLIQARHLIDAMASLPLFDFSPDCAIAPHAEAETDNLSPNFY